MKRHSKAKLKGTVLFTVISVMSLLIIFLTSTLVLATSASNRSHKNYASTQTEYTARAAIESFSEAMKENGGVAQMIVNMNKTDTLTPCVDLNNPSMGEIGYYKEDGTWVPGQISIEYIDDTYTYDTLKNVWAPQQVLKVTATAELAGEESTVSAFIRKKSPNEPQPLLIKGLQTAGGVTATTTAGYYSGALAMGISDDGLQSYSVGNSTLLDTDLTFINGNFSTAANLTVNVNKPSSGTVIMGNLNLVNPLTVNLNYTMSGDFVQKEIPHLYVDGNVSSSSHAISFTGNDSPYNIFAGSWDTWGKAVTLNNSDLYLMNSGANNQLGGTSTTKLTAWNTALHQRSETQFNSNGGNIYSKGNLKLSLCEIDGDVCVDGNVILENGAKINGNLIVNGNLSLNGADIGLIKKNIYAKNFADFSSQLIGGYTPVMVFDSSKFEEKENVHHNYDTENFESYTSTEDLGNGWWKDRDGNQYYGDQTTYYDCEGRRYVMNTWCYGVYFDSNLYSKGYLKDVFGHAYNYNQYNPNQYNNGYYVEVDFYGNEAGTAPTDQQYSYFNKSTLARVDKSATLVQRYRDASGNIVDASSAIKSIGSVDDYMASKSISSVYPANMTRENICGQKKNPDGTFSDYPDSNKKYKIITTLDEIKKSIGCNGTSFDSSIYYDGVNMPDEIKALYNADNSIKIGADSTGIKAGSNIVGSCVLTSADVLKKTVNIKPTGTIWIALDNIIAGGADQAFNIVVDDSAGSVNFYIKGTLKLDNSKILTKKVFNGNRTINESDKIGITFYGSDDSKIEYGNNCTIMGTAKCPYTEVTCSSTGGAISGITYNGSPAPYAPHWIGSALFEKTIGGNNFTLLYTGSGSSNPNTITNEYIGDSWEFMYYDVY